MTAALRKAPPIGRGTPNRRRGMLAKIHLAAKELGLAEDDRRALMRRVTGKASAGDMTDGELGLVLDELVSKGWKAAQPAGRVRSADHSTAKKARALWISLAQLGVVRNPAESALESFARRQLGVEMLQWANGAHCYGLIEALKKMAERAGWDQALNDAVRRQHSSGALIDVSDVVILKRRLAIAQAKTLQVYVNTGLQAHIRGLAEPELDALIADQGVKVRAKMTGAID